MVILRPSGLDLDWYWNLDRRSNCEDCDIRCAEDQLLMAANGSLATCPLLG